ncbi:S8 family peptidase [Phocaeicola sp.]
MRKYINFIGSAFLLIFMLSGCSETTLLTEDPTSTDLQSRSIESPDYYWYKGEKIPVTKNAEKEYILIRSTDEQSILTRSSGITVLQQPQTVTLSNKIRRKAKAVSEDIKWAIVESMTNNDSNPNILYQAPSFTSKSGEEMFLGHLFYVKLKSQDDLAKLENLAESENAEIIGNNEFMPLWYTLSCSKESTGNALELANKFYETGFFSSCQPDFICDDKINNSVNDPLYPSQWGLENTGQNGGTAGIDIKLSNARNITTGSNDIIVAVLDQGVELSHPDLNIYSKSYDTESGSSPSIIRGNHGTACAGIIGAKTNNNLGVAGIAPNCPLMSISNSLAGTSDSRQKRADGFNYAWKNGASVISNSWSSSVQYEILDDAISAALTNGRNGLGCVVVFASGNDNGSVSYPANSNPDILTVGAMSPCGQRKSPTSCDGESWWGSNYGTTLDVVAPGVLITTTDRTGSAGYTTGDYMSNFNGTSSACPHVAGVAALVLSVNPNLNQKQVADIIEKTAQKVGGYNYSTTSGRSNGTWNNEMGYGLVNAFAAVSGIVEFSNQTVSTNKTVSGSDIISTNVTVNNHAKLIFNFTNSITITKPFTVEQGAQIEFNY